MRSQISGFYVFAMSLLGSSSLCLAIFYPGLLNAGPDSGPMQKTVLTVNGCLVNIAWGGSNGSSTDLPEIELKYQSLDGTDLLVPLKLDLKKENPAAAMSRTGINLPAVIWSRDLKLACVRQASFIKLKPEPKATSGGRYMLSVLTEDKVEKTRFEYLGSYFLTSPEVSPQANSTQQSL